MKLRHVLLIVAIILICAAFSGCAGPSEFLHNVTNPRTGETIQVWSMGNDSGCKADAAGCWQGANKVYVSKFDKGSEDHEINFHAINHGMHTDWQYFKSGDISYGCAKITFPGQNSGWARGEVFCRFDSGEPRRGQAAWERVIVAQAMKEISL